MAPPPSGGSRGRVPLSPFFSMFMQFSAKIMANNRSVPSLQLASPLDPPLPPLLVQPLDPLLILTGNFHYLCLIGVRGGVRHSPVKGWCSKNVKKYPKLAVMHNMSFVKKSNRLWMIFIISIANY